MNRARLLRHTVSRRTLNYPGVGPEHSFLKDMKRVEYVPINDTEALQGFRDSTKPRDYSLRLKARTRWRMSLSLHRRCQRSDY